MFNKFRKVFILAVGITSFGLLQSVNADWEIDTGAILGNDLQDVVISLKSNPMSNPEMACLAVTFARSLALHPNYKDTSNVTLFVTLDGVSLADDSVVSSRRFKCDTPWGVISLKKNLDAFMRDNVNNMVVCPICWKARYGTTPPDYGYLPGPGDTAVLDVIMRAEKILDF